MSQRQAAGTVQPNTAIVRPSMLECARHCLDLTPSLLFDEGLLEKCAG
jgi:hypothetical protein